MKLPGMEELKSDLGKRFGGVGLVGERKALALLSLGFYVTLFFLITLTARTELPEWLPAFSAMLLVYGTAFFGVAAEWFWGRWFAIGLGYWGLTMAGMAFVSLRQLPPPLLFFGLSHGLVSICLLGDKMAAAFEAKPGWKERWKLDDEGVLRVRKSVTRAASSLPALIMFALAPREAEGIARYALPVFAVVGLSGLLTRRTFGVLALAAGGVLGIATSLFDPGSMSLSSGAETYASVAPFLSVPTALLGPYAAALLCAAALPFLRPMARYLRVR